MPAQEDAGQVSQAHWSEHSSPCSDYVGAPGSGGRERAGAQTAATAVSASSCRRWGSRLARRSWCALWRTPQSPTFGKACGAVK